MTANNSHWPPSASALREQFEAAPAYTVGIEDEVMLLAPDTLELSPQAPAILSLLDGDSRFKLELPASQIELVTPSCSRVGDAATALLEARRLLAQRSNGLVVLAAAGAHPFSHGVGELNRVARYEHVIREYGRVAERQLVCALQVHVSVGGAERALAVYNAARSYLPLIAALAANAPFYEGHDTGLASVRPKLGQLLPRQGVPPTIASWEAYAEILRWGAATGTFPNAQTWWWELRLHPRFGTIEFRVPDGQTRVVEAAAIAAVAQALVAWLGDRHDAGETLPIAAGWQIEENRWSACRHGIEGHMVDLRTATRTPTRSLLQGLLETLMPVAISLESGAWLDHAGQMVKINGALEQRAIGLDGGGRAVTRWLAQRFLDPV